MSGVLKFKDKLTAMKHLKDRDLSVGFVVSHPFSGSPGSVLRVRELSTSLSKFGVKVHIYCPYPQEGSWGKNVFFHRIPSMASTLGLQNLVYGLTRRVLNKLFFIRYILLKKKILDSMIHEFVKGLIESVDDGEVDIIQGEQEIAAIACVRARERLGIPVIASLHNIWPEELVAMDLIEKTSKEYGVLHDIEQEIVSGSDLLVVVSEEMARHLEDKYSAESSQILVIPPGGRVRISQVNNREPPFKVVYAGLVASRANLDLFIQSMPFVLEKHPDVKFYITRRGEDLKRVCRLAKEVGVSPLYYWFPKSEKFYEFLASCHVGVVPSSNDSSRRMGPAVKLFDYLSVGLPVVANDIRGWTSIIEEEKIGILTEDDPKAFASAIVQLLENPSLALRSSRAALECVRRKYSWDNSARSLLHGYLELLGRYP